MSGLLLDRRRLQRLHSPPSQPRCHTYGGVAGSSQEVGDLQAEDGGGRSPGRHRLGSDFNFDLNVWFTEEQQREGGIEYNYSREAPEREPLAGKTARKWAIAQGPRACRGNSGHDRNRRGHLHAREAGHERVCARGWGRLPYLFRLCARIGRTLGNVSVARPRSQGTQRDGILVSPSRRVRQALSQVMGVVASILTSDTKRIPKGRTHFFLVK